jgi:hypothetical protein
VADSLFPSSSNFAFGRSANQIYKMDFDIRPTWPTGLNAASGVVGLVSILFFYEALVAKKIVSCQWFPLNR